jgi:hypothetical protein
MNLGASVIMNFLYTGMNSQAAAHVHDIRRCNQRYRFLIQAEVCCLNMHIVLVYGVMIDGQTVSVI